MHKKNNNNDQKNQNTSQEGEQKFGFVAILGAPNAGKSTLVNRLVGEKVSIVTHKAQTTRFKALGIFQEKQSQVALVDTPGIFFPKRRLDRAMVASAWSGCLESDIILALFDVHSGWNDSFGEFTEKIKKHHKKTKIIAVLNKIDAMRVEDILPIADRMYETNAFEEIMMISALKGDGCSDLKDFLIQEVPTGPWMYPVDQVSDVNERLLSCELTREHILRNIHQEIPYDCTVEVEHWRRKRGGKLQISQVILVTRDSHRKIIIGKNGQTIKHIGIAAKLAVSQVLDEEVDLFLHVKAVKDWQNQRAHYQHMGLTFDNT